MIYTELTNRAMKLAYGAAGCRGTSLYISSVSSCGADGQRDRWFQKYIWALHIVTECIENYLEEQCD